MLVHDLVKKPEVMYKILEKMAEGDELMTKLIEISKRVEQTPWKQKIQICILRSDYMLDKNSQTMKLVEFNTIACAGSPQSQRVREVQSCIMTKYSEDLQF
jgi:hypothetical protein